MQSRRVNDAAEGTVAAVPNESRRLRGLAGALQGDRDPRSEDRAVFHRNRDGDCRSSAADLAEPILGADLGMIGKPIARVAIDSNDGTGKRSPDRQQGGARSDR